MAQVQTLINKFGTVAGWNNVKVTFLGRTVEGITEITYKDDVEMENVYGCGGYPVGQGRGNYKATASITLLSEEVQELQNALPEGVRLQDIPFSGVVSTERAFKIVHDTLHNCYLMNNGREMKQNDKVISVKFDMLISHIDWGK